MPFSKLESRYTIPPNCQLALTQTGGGTASVPNLSFAEGNYYLIDLLAQVQTQLNAQGGGSAYTVTVDDNTDSSTGKVTITKSAGTFTITWSLSSGLRDALGFTGTLTPAAVTFTGGSASPHIWLPTCGRVTAALGDGDSGWPTKTGTVAISPDGTTRTWVSASTRYEDVIAFDCLRGYRVLQSHEAVVNESLQTFWTYSIGLGKPFRYYKDRSVDGTYVPYVAFEEPMLSFRPERLIENQYGPNAMYRYRCPVAKYTGA